MKQIAVDLRRLFGVDVVERGFPVSGGPRSRLLSAIEQAALRGGLSMAGSPGSLAQDVMSIGDGSQHRLRLLAPGNTPALCFPPSVPIFTVALGVSGSAFAGLGVSFGGGLYGSTTPEVGIYTSAGAGVFLNAGVSQGPQVTIVFGPPSLFSGVCWGLGLSIDLVKLAPLPLALSVEGYCWFTPPKGAMRRTASGSPRLPVNAVGISFGVDLGMSALLVTISGQVSHTTTTALWRPHGHRP